MIKPLADRIVAKVIQVEAITKSKIILATVETGKPKIGEIVAVGIGRILVDGTRVAIAMNVGDKVMFQANAGTEIDYEGNKYIILTEHEVLAIVEHGEVK